MPGDMAEMLRIAGGDMHCIGAYRAMPTGSCRGGLVIMQEIFGVNAHIRALVEGFAAAGSCGIAPALFDHIEIRLRASDCVVATRRPRRKRSLITLSS